MFKTEEMIYIFYLYVPWYVTSWEGVSKSTNESNLRSALFTAVAHAVQLWWCTMLVAT